jgi:hypothetical protein
MPTTYQGGCRCGAIRCAIAAEPMLGGQYETGGGHARFMAFPAQAVKITGAPRFYEAEADSGNRVQHGFCPTCGSPVMGRSSGLPDMTTIPAGSLDDPSPFRPAFVVYTSRGHSWDFVDPALQSFAKMPPMPAAPA